MNIKYLRYPAVFLALLLPASLTTAQRIADPNTPGWYNSFNTIHFSKKISVWLEYQWRRDEVIRNWQQSLARTGIQYHFSNGVSMLAGYGYIVTFPYGDYPAGPYPIPENRIFEQLVWNDAIGHVQLNHRIRLEQRFIGKVDQKAAVYDVTEWIYLNRLRYQLRVAVPINSKKIENKTFYAASFDELFIGFGKNVNQNIFDQNRIGLLAGYQVNDVLKVEAGVFNQTVQQSILVAGKQVYQYNTGVMVNLYLTKK